MRNSITAALFCLAMILGTTLNANATLYDRGNGMIYSSDLNVTFLQDANYAMTSGYSVDGRMSWTDANTWAQNLVYGGYNDWRLPTFDESAPDRYSGSLQHELAYLYAWELGNLNYQLVNTGPFINLPPDPTIEPWFWTGTLYSQDSTQAWRFDFSCG